MPEFEVWQWLLGTGVTFLLGYLTYRGGKIQAKVSKDGISRTAQVDEQQSALEAWKELNQPLRDELAQVRADLTQERKERREKEQADEVERIKDTQTRAEEKQRIAVELQSMTERIDKQAEQIKHWKRLAKTIARFAVQMRDEVLRRGGTVPVIPDELLLIQALDDGEEEDL